MKQSICCIAFLSLIALETGAATVLDIEHRKGPSRIYSDDDKGRMDLPGSDRYMIIDIGQKHLYLVKPSKQEVLDLSFFMGQLGGSSAGPNTNSALLRKGPGPSVAGYETVRFDYVPGGVLCGSIFTSQPAMKDSGMARVFALLQEAAAKAESFSSLFKKKGGPCQGAESLAAADIGRHGLPMRIVDKDGVRWSEVTAIKKNADIPSGLFAIPKNYKVNDVVRIRERVQQTIKQHLPQINELLKQLQPGGGAPAAGQ